MCDSVTQAHATQETTLRYLVVSEVKVRQTQYVSDDQSPQIGLLKPGDQVELLPNTKWTIPAGTPGSSCR